MRGKIRSFFFLMALPRPSAIANTGKTIPMYSENRDPAIDDNTLSKTGRYCPRTSFITPSLAAVVALSETNEINSPRNRLIC